MNRNQIHNIMFFATCAAIVGVSVKSIVDISRQEEAKREEMRAQAQLDIQAIHNASKVVRSMIDAGHIRSLSQLSETVNNEIAFQKIAIREK